MMNWDNDTIVREIFKLRPTFNRIHWQDVATLMRRVRDDTIAESQRELAKAGDDRATIYSGLQAVLAENEELKKRLKAMMTAK